MNELAILRAQYRARERRMDRLYEGMAYFRYRHATDVALEQRAIIADVLDCRIVKTLSGNDLIRLTDAADTSGIPEDKIRRFWLADLVMEAVRIETGETCYIAVEIAFNASLRDTRHAARNAEFLRRFTGKDALAVVAGVRKDCCASADIAANKAAWYPLEEDEEDLELESG